jgi:hypothetical protein
MNLEGLSAALGPGPRMSRGVTHNSHRGARKIPKIHLGIFTWRAQYLLFECGVARTSASRRQQREPVF